MEQGVTAPLCAKEDVAHELAKHGIGKLHHKTDGEAAVDHGGPRKAGAIARGVKETNPEGGPPCD
eukprot:3187297-Lingulodinium_polyedra.AAC.1